MEIPSFCAFFESCDITVSSLLQETMRSKIYSGTYRSTPAVIKLQRLPPGTDFTLMEREYLVLTNIRHRHILQLYSAVWTLLNDAYYLVLVVEPCDTDLGKDYMRRKTAGERYSEEELWAILIGLVDALAHMQTQHCAHRDIKPANIFMKDGKVKLGDLGTAKFFDPGLEDASTVAGTPAFLSPLLKAGLLAEMQSIKHNLHKSDCYSLGVSIYALATLKPPLPFISATITDQESAKLVESIQYSSKMKEVIHWMVNVDEANRCDFLQLKEWLTEVKRPQWTTDVVEVPDSVECLVCGTVQRRTELSGNVIALDCDPLNHVFCNAECFSLFLQGAAQPYRCPKCQAPVAEELTRKSKLARIKETGSSMLWGLTSKAKGWFGQ